MPVMVVLWKHAARRMVERHIATAWIEAAITAPDRSG
ncbi:DUF4258 domain-containing protein [Roseicella aquatilis]|uniref:DUF4258 domain-containing protein n=1 Tax=Roseicella aquatilis TaxID=2527868 RepID=A0A4R4D4N1_9PROT|nr:DUF4258 domain-containing protein [Roseicella aquatilis]